MWARGWREHDVESILDLYADDAVFRSAPFRDASGGRGGVREYVEWAFASERSVECRFGPPIAAGGRAAVEYWAVVETDGGVETLAGVALLRFGDDGRVAEQHDVWSTRPGRHEAPDGWLA